MIDARKFRAALYYRLNVFPVHVPALRDRPEDIPLLVRYFARQYARRMGRSVDVTPPPVMDALVAYSWPGNIRNLQNPCELAATPSTRAAPALPVPHTR